MFGSRSWGVQQQWRERQWSGSLQGSLQFGVSTCLSHLWHQWQDPSIKTKTFPVFSETPSDPVEPEEWLPKKATMKSTWKLTQKQKKTILTEWVYREIWKNKFCFCFQRSMVLLNSNRKWENVPLTFAFQLHCLYGKSPQKSLLDTQRLCFQCPFSKTWSGLIHRYTKREKDINIQSHRIFF